MVTMQADANPRNDNAPEEKEVKPGAPSALENKGDGDKKEEMFSNRNITSDSEVPPNEQSTGSVFGSSRRAGKPIVITAEEKLAFVDAVVGNTRFTKDYSLFGGRITFTLRSLTSEEVQALAAWIVKKGTSDPTAQMSGKYKKYLLAAQVARFNGTDMEPLETPLFETLAKDGKTIIPPGWIGRCAYWDEQSTGLVQAMVGCLADFDIRYSTLCSKAEDENFWAPDTP